MKKDSLYINLMLMCMFNLNINSAANTVGYINANDAWFLYFVEQGKVAKVEEFIKSGININASNKLGNTALITAAHHNNKDLVKLLIDSGANINAIGQNGETALMHAVVSGNKDIVKLLINAKVDVNIASNDKLTPLMLAAHKRFKDIAKLLIDAGADVNARDKDGTSALNLATIKQDKEIVKLLIDAGANVNVIDKYGNTPLMRAAGEGHKNIVELLLTAGANLDIKDKYGGTAIDLVRLNSPWYSGSNKEGIVKLIEAERKKREDAAIVQRQEAIKKIINESNILIPVISPVIAEYAVGGVEDVPEYLTK